MPFVGLEVSSIHVSTRSAASGPVKVDFVWVVDNSSSMCQEQAALADGFDVFLGSLESGLQELDARIAVVTMDLNGSAGAFAFEPPEKVHFACGATQQIAAPSSDQCSAACGDHAKSELPAVWWQGGVMCQCRQQCDVDADCAGLGQGYECVVIGDTSACKPPLGTDGCPDGATLRSLMPAEAAYLTHDNARDLFGCVARAETNEKAGLEQGLGSVLSALDAAGPQAVQAQHFLRDDAWLVVVFMSDEDDCTLKPWESFTKEQAVHCTDFPDKLLPIDSAVNRLKALKPRPEQVIVATIVGDVESPDQRAEFLSFTAQLPWHKKTFACVSDTGTADLASRYIELTQRFGPNGIMRNICEPGGVGAALEHLAARVVGVVSNICLPRPPQGQPNMVVTRFGPNGEASRLSPGEFEVVHSPDCGDSAGGLAVKLAVSLSDAEWVEVDYEAKASE